MVKGLVLKHAARLSSSKRQQLCKVKRFRFVPLRDTAYIFSYCSNHYLTALTGKLLANKSNPLDIKFCERSKTGIL